MMLLQHFVESFESGLAIAFGIQLVFSQHLHQYNQMNYFKSKDNPCRFGKQTNLLELNGGQILQINYLENNVHSCSLFWAPLKHVQHRYSNRM